eukprot:11535862-Karenia_brevis.AAC.1
MNARTKQMKKKCHNIHLSHGWKNEFFGRTPRAQALAWSQRLGIRRTGYRRDDGHSEFSDAFSEVERF